MATMSRLGVALASNKVGDEVNNEASKFKVKLFFVLFFPIHDFKTTTLFSSPHTMQWPERILRVLASPFSTMARQPPVKPNHARTDPAPLAKPHHVRPDLTRLIR